MDDSIRFMSSDDLSSCCVGNGQRDHEKATVAVRMWFTCGSDVVRMQFRCGWDAVGMRFGCSSGAVQMGYCDDLEQSIAESRDPGKEGLWFIEHL